MVAADLPPSAARMLAVARRYLPEDRAEEFVRSALGHLGPALVLLAIRPDRWLTADSSAKLG